MLLQHHTETGLSDEKLFQLCKRYGEQALHNRRKFIGLLPEVRKRRLYEKKGFSSIFEFAAKLAGISNEQVRVALNLEKKFLDKPILHSLLVTGEVSANKLVRIASIATTQNEPFLATQVQCLSQKAVETLVKDEKNALSRQTEFMNADSLSEPLFDHKSLRAHSNPEDFLRDVKLLAKLSSEVKNKLMELADKGIDVNQIIVEALVNRDGEIRRQKETIASECGRTKSRHIPKMIITVLTKEHGNKCSIAGCKRQSEHIHHTQRFALAGTHDPRYLAPLCKAHHEIAHSLDLKMIARKLAERGDFWDSG